MTMQRFLLGLSLSLLTQSCAQTPAQAPQSSVLERYVALGDSITAGYQSGGLEAEGQRSAYPLLLGELAGKPLAGPIGKGPGCPPPLNGEATAESCVRADPQAENRNFAVPGARVEELTVKSAANVQGEGTRALYNLILGPNDTQVSAALKAKPSLISVWIGSNNVLAAALNGNPAQATPVATFENEYARLLDALKPSGAKIVLLTVPDVSQIPALISGKFLAQYGLADNTCAASEARISAQYVLPQVTAWLSGGSFTPLSCTEAYALTPQEAAQFKTIVDGYNASIRSLAQARGHLVFDVAPLLNELDKPNPNLQDFSRLFGEDFSLDGVHPSSSAHTKLAAALARFLNTHLEAGIAVR
ncbi:lysophospholipase L1-like esterase [Deinobacterium chartae]|uniref:Lysophospholipase L1-like esterase n=1 Tax=Deinobacterium chartae TaxID=521158 RepID=A0A841I130_9DEIO|nr:SGNH/GDSL hydrolase family protein [Deinobacterium chartae]MBB6098140.1 lysophospholipase L1-like esterase [Deinobacterium chartae]